MALARVTTLPRRALRAAASRRSLQLMRCSDSTAVRTLAGALHAASTGRFPSDSRAWFARIEELRRTLDATDESIDMIDFGAGLTTSTRTDAEMHSGLTHRGNVGRISRTASLPTAHGQLLYAIVRAFGVRRGIELGTCLGISAAYQAAGLSGVAGARFTTCEGSPALAELAGRNLAGLGLTECSVVAGRFADTLPAVIEQQRPIDYAFVDGHHDEQATIRYFEQIRPHVSRRAALVFDDITWSAGMARAWDFIQSARGLAAAVDLGRLGIVVIDDDATADAAVRYRVRLRPRSGSRQVAQMPDSDT